MIKYRIKQIKEQIDSVNKAIREVYEEERIEYYRKIYQALIPFDARQEQKEQKEPKKPMNNIEAIEYLRKVNKENPSQQLADAIAYLTLMDNGGLSNLVQRVRDWGTARNIIGGEGCSTPYAQYRKLLEEVDEINDGLSKEDQHAIIDGIGDATVVLILLAELVGVRFETCLLAAYEEIKDRKGRMVNGVFVKEKSDTQQFEWRDFSGESKEDCGPFSGKMVE